MAMKLEKVVPFGRSFDEYVQMFNLSEADLGKRILGVGDGPASFNAEATQIGGKVASVDPVYQFNGAEILERFNQVVDNIIEQIRRTPDDWVWSYHRSPEGLRTNRVNTIHRFIQDYGQGKQAGRYQIGALPKLNFRDNEYDLALCSHFLFLYSDHYDYSFHDYSIREMLRVSKEVRIFPLLTLMLQQSPHLGQIIRELSAAGYEVEITKVGYELQKGGDKMLVVRK